MPVVEKYGLMVLFGLCALIVSVGIFAEDPLTKEALAQKQEAVESPSDEFDLQEDNESVIFNDSDWAPARPEAPRGEGLMSYSPSDEYDGQGPDPKRESSLGGVPKSKPQITEKGEKGRPAQEGPANNKSKTRSYVVKKGDSLGRIARKQLGSTRYADEIRRANPQIKNDVIYAGKTIWIPILDGSKKTSVAKGNAASGKPTKVGATPVKTHYITVKKGETLMAIAKREYGDQSKWKELARRNGIKKGKDLRDSQKLLIPSDL